MTASGRLRGHTPVGRSGRRWRTWARRRLRGEPTMTVTPTIRS